MKRLNDPKLVAEEYATLERVRDRRLDRTGWLRDPGEPIDTMLRAVSEKHPRRVLDAGCGTGEIAALLTAPEVVCVDLSAAAVEAARSRGLDARIADVQHLPFADGEFDVVLGNWLLYHLPDLEQGLAEVARVLAPQHGRFVGCYNRDDHLSELWTVVDPGSSRGDDYAAPLGRIFAHVERRDTDGEVVWLTRDDLQRYLDAYGGPLANRRLTAPGGPYPFIARRRNCVWVADR